MSLRDSIRNGLRIQEDVDLTSYGRGKRSYGKDRYPDVDYGDYSNDFLSRVHQVALKHDPHSSIGDSPDTGGYVQFSDGSHLEIDGDTTKDERDPTRIWWNHVTPGSPVKRHGSGVGIKSALRQVHNHFTSK